MATVSKRTWQTKNGEIKCAWRLSYHDRNGRQHRLQFKTKREAEDARVLTEGQLATGTHVPDRHSITVVDAARAFLADYESIVSSGKRERSTLVAYQQHVDFHIAPFDIGGIKLSRLNGPDCQAFASSLETSRSDAMALRVFRTLRMILQFAWGRGWIHSNPAKAVSIRTARVAGDDDGKVAIPPKVALKVLLDAAKKYDATGRAEALVSVLIFAGLRTSELRGLRLDDLKLSEGLIQVRQRADRWQRIGQCKTSNSIRDIPIPPATVHALKRWSLACPKGPLGLVFPTSSGKVESHPNLFHRQWTPLMAKTGLAKTITKKDLATGEERQHVKPIFDMKTLRHVAISLWIEQGATPKQVTTWAGHHSVTFTLDVYGHLWKSQAADHAIAEAAERSVLA